MELNYHLFSKYRKQLMGVAALFIVVFHYNEFLESNGVTLSFVQNRLLHSFNVGVDIFLLLSGIGLYFSYQKKPKFKDYYIKRILNVYVIFLLINLPYTLYYNFVFDHKSVWNFLLDWLSFSYFLPSAMDNRPGWYVTFIMIIYLLFPPIFYLYRKLEKKKLDLVLTVLFFGAWIAISYVLNSAVPETFACIEIGFTRIPIFMLGCYFGKKVYHREKFGYGF